MKAYITLLATDNYIQGVVALSRSLRLVSSRYPLYVAVSQNVSEAVCKKLEAEHISIIRLSKSVIDSSELHQQLQSHWSYTFDKLQMWSLTQFEKMVFLDSDMMVVRNIDHLFDYEAFSAVAADHSYPGNEGWVGGLNSGLMVIKPDQKIATSLAQLATSVISQFQRENKSVGDQDVIKSYCSNWATSHQLHLDEGYNLFADHITYYIRNLDYALSVQSVKKPIYVIHFVGKYKPWMRIGVKDAIRFLISVIKNPYYIVIYNKYRALLK